MADLIEKYFKEDLTEAEREALRQELSSADNAAEKFGDRAEEIYRALGLPEPHWTGPDSFRPATESNLWKWLVFWFLCLGGIGTLGWFLFKGNLMSETSTVSVRLETTPAPRLSRHLKPREMMKDSSDNEPLMVAQAQTSGPRRDQVPLPTFTPVPSVPTPAPIPSMAPKLTPVNVDKNPGQFSSLSVVLRRATSGFISVRVLDPTGAEVLPLYKGNLPAGSWAFTWNGLLKNGLVAPPGKYRIEVKAGSWVQIKEVLIQK